MHSKTHEKNQLSARKTPSRSSRSQRGFTLVEVMMAAFLLLLGSMGALKMVQQAYEYGAIARHRDQARSVLNYFSDQFLRSSSAANPTFFQVTTEAAGSYGVGTGMTWTDEDGVQTGTSSGLAIKLGTAANSKISATVYRKVHEIVESTGALSDSDTSEAGAGRMISGEFTIVFTFKGIDYTQQVYVARATQ